MTQQVLGLNKNVTESITVQNGPVTRCNVTELLFVSYKTLNFAKRLLAHTYATHRNTYTTTYPWIHWSYT